MRLPSVEALQAAQPAELVVAFEAEGAPFEVSRGPAPRQGATRLSVRASPRRSGALTARCAAYRNPVPAAQVVELVDTLDSGSSGRKVMEVRLLSWALTN